MDVKEEELFLDECLKIERKSFLEKDEYFMAIALLVGRRSKDPWTQVGTCIVNEDQKIVGTGYNDMPNGCDGKFGWDKFSDNPLDNKYMYVCHAATNAVLDRDTKNLKNCKIYTGLFPCNECAKILIQSGIKEVIYLSDKRDYRNENIASKRLLQAAGVNYRQFKYDPKKSKIVIDFGEIDWDNRRKRSNENEGASTSKKNSKNNDA